MSQAAALFDEGLERYKAGESPQSLIPVFQDVCDRAPRNASAWSCLAWLYLLTDKPDKACKAAQKGVKLDPQAPQARINLALAMLDAGQTGVRQHIQAVQQMLGLDAQIRSDIAENIADGLARKPDWESMHRVKGWLFDS
ncbi:MAG: tetratricopeptide repeat protein [Cyanophyceae cyanobacterium]